MILQGAGVRTVIPDRVPHRHVEKLSADQLQALRAAAWSVTSASGQRLMRHRGEYCERSFVHGWIMGGPSHDAPRRENILKRYLVQAACLNLSIFLRHLTGLGTLKQTWAAAARALSASTRNMHIGIEHVMRVRPGRRSRRAGA